MLKLSNAPLTLSMLVKVFTKVNILTLVAEAIKISLLIFRIMELKPGVLCLLNSAS